MKSYRQMSDGEHRYLQSHSRSFNRLVEVQVEWHEHPMVQLSLPNLYRCGACKEAGAGKRLSCQSCSYEVHEFCGKAPSHLKLHPLHPQHQLLLHTPKPSGILKSKCDVCGKASKGLTYRCSVSGCGYQLHPTCAMLSPKTNFPNHPSSHPLILSPPEAARSTKLCGECKRARMPGHLYTCTLPDCDYVLHAACAKTMVNGLLAHGFKDPLNTSTNNNTVLGAAARIASHVVIGFIGGLVEGIGEGVGDALTQSIVSRGDHTRSRSRSSRSPMPRQR